MSSPIRDRYFDPVQVVQIGSLTAGLEGAVASASGVMLLWGWMSDPDGELRNTVCVLDGQVLPVEVLDRIARPDIVEVHAGAVRSKNPNLGLLALARADEASLRRAGGRVSLQIEGAAGTAFSSNRLLFEPGSSFRAEVEKRLPVHLMQPAAVRRAAEALLWPEAARLLSEARRNLAVRTYGPVRDPALSVVIPVLGDGFGLRETLAYLDMSRDRALLEAVIAPASDRHADGINRAVRDSRAGLKVVVVQTGEELGPGGAARLGLDACTASTVALTSEAVVPPGDWRVSDVLSDLEFSPLALPRALPRFDGLEHRLRLDFLENEHVGPQHHSPSVTDWSPDLVVGRREALLSLDFPWNAPLTGAGFWAALLGKVVEAGAAPLSDAGRFTYAPVGPPADESDTRKLLDSFALQDLIAPVFSPAPSVPFQAPAAA